MKCVKCRRREAIEGTAYCFMHQPEIRTGPQHHPEGPEEPIIISGGSVSVQLPKTFEEKDSHENKMLFKRDGKVLKSIIVNGAKIMDLSPSDVIKIEYD